MLLFLLYNFPNRGLMMIIDFDEEIKKFHPNPELEDMESIVYNQDISDVADYLIDLLREYREQSRI